MINCTVPALLFTGKWRAPILPSRVPNEMREFFVLRGCALPGRGFHGAVGGGGASPVSHVVGGAEGRGCSVGSLRGSQVGQGAVGGGFHVRERLLLMAGDGSWLRGRREAQGCSALGRSQESGCGPAWGVRVPGVGGTAGVDDAWVLMELAGGARLCAGSSASVRCLRAVVAALLWVLLGGRWALPAVHAGGLRGAAPPAQPRGE